MALRIQQGSKSVQKIPRRAFGTSPTCLRVHKTNPRFLLPQGAPEAPLYPYGPARFYKQSDSGLYGGLVIQFGNNVGPKSKVKTRRRWLPNVVHKRLFSASLDRFVTLKVATRVLRTIDKVGGLDNYLLGHTSARLKELGQEGWKLRWAVMQTPSVQERMKTDPRLRRAALHMQQVLAGQVELLPLAESATESDAELENVPRREDEETELEEQVEERIKQNIRASDFMQEQMPPQPPSLWQRMTGFFRR